MATLVTYFSTGGTTAKVAKEFAEKTFHRMEAADLTPDRILDPAKSLAETVTIHLKQPTPPIKIR